MAVRKYNLAKNHPFVAHATTVCKDGFAETDSPGGLSLLKAIKFLYGVCVLERYAERGRKFAAAALCVVMLISLCGCSVKGISQGESLPYLVAAIGFDSAEDGVAVLFETVMVNSEDAEADRQVVLLSGTGASPQAAATAAAEKSAAELMLGHVATIVIGGGVSAEQFWEIMNYCYDQDDINLSAVFVAAESAEQLLGCRPQSTVAMGYDITSMQQQQARLSGAEFKNRFYEIEAARGKSPDAFSLPYFQLGDDSYKLAGRAVYKNSNLTVNIK